ncbi:MAG: exonuclease SbcCD subunit D C-terminal domain-containing protein, partial [Elusimicrobiales bacterium]|nr:exonuclease SbcCD subunit D C-terminal domain-containing protein [Elusimicrobiales bacterium]
SIPSPDAVRLLDEILSEIIIDRKIPILIINGNHDSPERLSFGSKIFSSNKLFIKTSFKDVFEPLKLEDEWGKVSFWFLPYMTLDFLKSNLKDEGIKTYDEAVKKISKKITESFNSSRNVLLAHLFVENGVTSESERPFSVGGTDAVDTSAFKDFSYVACGHLHKPQERNNLVYSGSPYKYSFSEADHKKRYILTDIGKNGEVKTENLEIKFKRDLRIVKGKIDDILKNGEKDGNKDDYILANILDKEIIYDPVGKISKVYPNILKIERPDIPIRSYSVTTKEIQKSESPLRLFEKFYKDIWGEEPSKKEIKAVEEILKDISEEEGV